jgi:regulator of cell morphogenesis and NO signaling
MTSLVPTATLRSIALAEPATIRVFENFHLDYCCGGRRPLDEVCREKQLDVDQVLAALERAANGPAAEVDLSQATATGVIEHIVSTHHAFVRAELTRLLPMAEKIAAKHAVPHPEVLDVERGLKELAADLLPHLEKEERVLFPYVEALERSLTRGETAPRACFSTIESPIQQMLHEHEAAGALLAGLRQATGNFTAPADACPTFAGLYHGIEAFEHDLHQHIHLENNLLFPMALAMERELRAL